MSSAVRQGVCLGGASKDLPVASISRLRPRAAVWLTWLLAQAPLPGHILGSPRCTRWRARGTWVSLMTPQRNAAEV